MSIRIVIPTMTKQEAKEIIQTYLQRKLYYGYKVLGVKVRWLGKRNKEEVYAVNYFCTSHRFIGGGRYERIAIKGKEVYTIEDEC